jgi:hypothetical protein
LLLKNNVRFFPILRNTALGGELNYFSELFFKDAVTLYFKDVVKLTKDLFV